MESYLKTIWIYDSGKILMKGQAAIEYLTTYGWAIFALVLAMVVLLSSGILTPNAFVSEECAFGTNIKCNFALYNDVTTHLKIDVFNGFPYKIRIDSVDLRGTDGVTVSGFEKSIEIESGGHAVFNGTLADLAAVGAVKRFNGNITYSSCASELGTNCSSPHSLTGRVVGKVLEK